MKNTSQQIIYGNSTITPSANANRILNDKVKAIEVNKYQLNRHYKSIEESKFYKQTADRMSKLMDGRTNEHTNDRMSQRYWS